MSQHNDYDLKHAYLQGHFLVASPSLREPRFEKSVIYVTEHHAKGAKGLVINKINPLVKIESLFEQVNINCQNTEHLRHIHMYDGGPVQAGRGWVIHTPDYTGNDTQCDKKNGLCITTTIDILEAIAEGKGPKKAHIILGGASWSPYQLENELVQHAWLLCPADASLIFDTPAADCWTRAMSLLGVQAGFMSDAAGLA